MLGWVPHHIALNHQQVDASQRPAYLLAVVQRWLGLALRLVVGKLAVAVVALATQLPRSSSSSAALIGAGLVTLMSLAEGLMYVVQMYANLETSAGAVARLKAFSERVRSEGCEDDDGGVVVVELPAEWPMQGRIRLDGVSATYE